MRHPDYMADSSNSCRMWQHILNKKEPEIRAVNCFEPPIGQCVDYKLNDKKQNVSVQEPSVVKDFTKPESPVRRLINIEAECSKLPNSYKPEKCCTLQDESANHSHNLCSTKCRALITTNLNSKEVIMNSYQAVFSPTIHCISHSTANDLGQNQTINTLAFSIMEHWSVEFFP